MWSNASDRGMRATLLVKSLNSADLDEYIYTSKGDYVLYNVRPFEQRSPRIATWLHESNVSKVVKNRCPHLTVAGYIHWRSVRTTENENSISRRKLYKRPGEGGPGFK